jgi:hypothetical protein
MKIAFILNDLRLSGGVNVVLQHASRMASNNDVFFMIREEIDDTWYEALVDRATIIPPDNWSTGEYDVAVATYWETLLVLGDVRAKSYVWFCQLYEDRFFPDRNPSISSMQVAGAMPIPVVTEAHWLQELLTSENPDRSIEVVLNGVDKEVFNERLRPHSPPSGFTVLIEGSLDALAKNTAYAIEGSLRSTHASRITHVGNRPFETKDPRYHFIPSGLSFDEMANLYRSHHVQVKTPLAEGMFGPPLEGFHCGLPAIVTPVTGAEEYIEDGENSLVVMWDDPAGVGRAIDLLAENRELWARLQNGARRTAQAWPGWDEQATLFRHALLRVAQTSKLTQSDLGNLGRTIQFADMMHWLAIRRLSDKSAGPRVMEELIFGPPSAHTSLPKRITRKIKSLVARP